MDPLPPEIGRDLAVSLRDLMRATESVLTSEPSELATRVTEHIGCPIDQIPNVVGRWAVWEHVNLQRGVDAYLAEYSPDAEWFGVSGSGRGYHDLVDMLTAASSHRTYGIGAVDYVSAAVDFDESVDVVQFGLVRTVSPGEDPVVLAVRGASDGEACALQVLAADRSAATAVRERVEELMRVHDVFRGQILSFGFSEYRGNRFVTFQPRPALTADQVVLPDGVLQAIERHVVLPADRAATLTEAGQHLKRGLLLHGPPGTGKTHTVRYLLSRLTDSTVIVVSGPALEMIGEAAALARRLQPAVVVVEDVDLIARDRSYSRGGHPLLFALLNEMDGVKEDADVTFVLTTNRVETMEQALTDRPGRVDLAIEIPRPDAPARERLLRLYTRDVEVDLAGIKPMIEATQGVTASFIREWARRSVIACLDDPGDRVRLDTAALGATLAELMDERNALTRSILGGARPDDDQVAWDDEDVEEHATYVEGGGVTFRTVIRPTPGLPAHPD